MSNLLTLYNGALLLANAAPLAVLEDTSKLKRDCDVFYALERPALLRSYRWPFAMRRVVLSPEAATPAFGYRRRMRLPADCLHVIGASPHADEVKELLTGAFTTYRVEDGSLMTDFDQMHVLYVADVNNPALFDPLFARVLMHRMASHLAHSVSNDHQLAVSLAERAEVALKQARRTTSIEQPAEVPDTYGRFDARGRFGRLGIRRIPE